MATREAREQTRQRLVTAAAREFAKRGVDACSVDLIAKAAGLTKGAVYSNFRTKDELIFAVMDEHRTIVDPSSLLDATLPLRLQLRDFGRAVAKTLRGADRQLVLLDRALQTYLLSHPRAMKQYRRMLRDICDLGGTALEEAAAKRDEALPMPGRQFVEVLMALTRGMVDGALHDADLLDEERFADAFALLCADPR